MHIAIIGATGMVGADLINEAARREHTVTGYSRHGSHRLDLSDTPSVVDTINAHDLTIISVSGRDDFDALIAAHRALLSARPTGRFLTVGGAGGLKVDGVRLVDTPDFPAEYLEQAMTLARVLEIYESEAAGLDWTVALPSP